MSFHFADIARQAASDRVISSEEILELRRAGWADGSIGHEEAHALFKAQDALAEPSTEWTDFFIEALRNYVLEGAEPRGYVSDDVARWLITQIENDGRICSMAELELLVQIVEKASNVPELLKTFILDVIEEEVMTGTGPTRCGGDLADSHVTSTEAQILRRVIFGQGGETPAGVSRSEAEMLFRIKDATTTMGNAPEFARLFVQGVGNYLMGFASGSAQISRERASELEGFIADNRPQVGRFMGRMANSAPNAFGKVFGRKAAHPAREERVAQAAEVTGDEQAWLNAQIAANGKVDDYDQALLDFLAEETKQI